MSGGTGALTDRQREILRFVAAGMEADVIARQLSIGTATVRRHLRSALEKLEGGRRSRASAVRSPRTDRQTRAFRPRPRHFGRTHAGRVLAREVDRAADAKLPLTVLILQVWRDGALGEFGPNYARALPDFSLSSLTHAVRRDDWLFPWSDGKYLMILPGSDTVGARAVAHRLKALGRDYDFDVGSAEWSPGLTPVDLAARAEEAVEVAKVERLAERSLSRAAHDGAFQSL